MTRDEAIRLLAIELEVAADYDRLVADLDQWRTNALNWEAERWKREKAAEADLARLRAELARAKAYGDDVFKRLRDATATIERVRALPRDQLTDTIEGVDLDEALR